MSNKQYELPEVTFSTFVMSLASSALVQLGEVPNPETNQTNLNLLLAKHSIDIISMLNDKIKNGLSHDETALINNLLYELQVKYIIKQN